nr:glycosyltransferase [Curtobacterium sp. S6]
MKILHLSGSARGGAELQLLHMLEESQDDPDIEHSVFLLRPGPLQDNFTSLIPTITSSKSRMMDVRFIRQFVRTLLDSRPDVVHAWGPTPNLWAPLLSRIAQLSPSSLKRRYRPRVIIAEVGLDEWKNAAFKLADRLCYLFSDAVVGNARAVTETAIARGARRRQTDTVLMGVSVPGMDEIDERSPVSGRVLMLGRWDWRKGHEALLDLWPDVRRRVPHATLVIAGAAHSDGEKALKARCEDIVRGYQKDPVVAGSITLLDHTDPARALDSAEVLAVSSNSEGMPNVILEAFSRMTPVVAFSVGGVAEALGDGERGWLVPAGERDAFVSALVQALSRPEEAGRRAGAARRWVESLTFKTSMNRWVEIYHRVTGR